MPPTSARARNSARASLIGGEAGYRRHAPLPGVLGAARFRRDARRAPRRRPGHRTAPALRRPGASLEYGPGPPAGGAGPRAAPRVGARGAASPPHHPPPHPPLLSLPLLP